MVNDNNINASASGNSMQSQDRDTVREAQRALNDKGFSAGAVDGIMGPHTEQALRDFQQSQGIGVTGSLDAPTLSALGVAD
ncbi:MAG TPA: peptidoglycan-binding domain-containing protein [Casimicrobiaceae bacterium]|nr:peptidoglycan-binding domain-containing protein [Casimicrobiaceae bacterium]